MSGFLKRREARQAYMNAGGSRKEFNKEYRNAKKSLRESGMSARDARRTARANIYAQSQLDSSLQDLLNQDFTDNSELENIQNTNLDTAISRMDLKDWQNTIATPIPISGLRQATPQTIVTQERIQTGPNYDQMSFADAFAIARKLHGPNGTFMWKGKTYGTKYANEVTFADWGARPTPQQNAEKVVKQYIRNLNKPSLSGMSPWM